MSKIIKNGKPIFVGEISANHNGKISNALKLIDDAKKYGADYVKLQTYTADTMTIKSNRSEFKIKKGLWKNKTLWDLYKKAQTPFEWQEKLFKYAKKKNIGCFSTPFDFSAIEILENLNCPIYKIASFEITHLPLIKAAASTKKPIIISTGTASLKEIDEAYNCANKYGSNEIFLLYCITNYPAKSTDFNLKNISFLKKRYSCEIGLSDHSKGNEIAKLAIAAGAKIFEKHIALKNVIGPDYEFSLKGNEIKNYSEDIKKVSSLFKFEGFNRKNTENFYKKYRRSIYAIKNIKPNEKFTQENLKIIRPATGIAPKFLDFMLKRRSPVYIKKNTPITKKILTSLQKKN